MTATVEVLTLPRRADDRAAPYAVLRRRVARRLGVPPGDIRVVQRCHVCGSDEHGKPEIAGHDVSVSVAHSGLIGVVAIAEGVRVGVDVEVVRPRTRLDRLAARVFGASELAEWQLLDDPDDALRAFLRAWTAKEAFLKGLGVGLTRPLRDADPAAEGWHVVVLEDLPEGCVTAVATDGPAQLEVVHLHDGEADDTDDTDAGNRPAPVQRFARSATGGVFVAALLGLQDALEGRQREEVDIVVDYSGDPPFTDPIVLRLDPDNPADSIVMVRPWLRERSERSEPSEPGEPGEFDDAR